MFLVVPGFSCDVGETSRKDSFLLQNKRRFSVQGSALGAPGRVRSAKSAYISTQFCVPGGAMEDQVDEELFRNYGTPKMDLKMRLPGMQCVIPVWRKGTSRQTGITACIPGSCFFAGFSGSRNSCLIPQTWMTPTGARKSFF